MMTNGTEPHRLTIHSRMQPIISLGLRHAYVRILHTVPNFSVDCSPVMADAMTGHKLVESKITHVDLTKQGNHSLDSTHT